jgi:hypothetical protein
VATYQKRRVCVLVKAYPQPSKQYEETVCVAAVTEDHRLARLYPVRFRHLDPARRFDRFDWIEAEMSKASEDPRPESHRVKEDSITILKHGKDAKPEERAKLWLPCVVPSLTTLYEAQKETGKSLGIVRPDAGSVRFKYQAIARADQDEREALLEVYRAQKSLLEDPLKPLPAPEYAFRYQFTSDGHPHSMQIHDWEIQATYEAYKRRYGGPDSALEKMVEYFEQLAPARNLHLIMGNLYRRPWVFIIIGILRTTADLDQVSSQTELF